MTALYRTFKACLADRSGATAVEYSLIAALIVVAVLGGLTSVADANDATYELIESELVI